MAEAHIASRSRHRGAGSISSRTPSSVNRSGAVDESDFEKMFAETPHVTILSAKHLVEEMSEIHSVVGNEKGNWETRVAALKKFRGLVKNGSQDNEQFFQFLRELEEPFSKAVVDLRSQLVRETCVAISFCAVSFGVKFDHFAAAVLPSLFQLLSNSAKIISSSGHICITFIAKHVHSHTLIPLFANTVASRSSVVRRRGAEYISQLLSMWETKQFDRHTQELENTISKVIVDSDPGARAAARNAYWSYSDHYKKKAEKLLLTFDSSTQKLLHQTRPSNTAVLSTPQRGSVRKSSLPPKMSKIFHSSAPDLSDDVRRPLTPSHRKVATHPPSTPSRINSTSDERGSEVAVLDSTKSPGLKSYKQSTSSGGLPVRKEQGSVVRRAESVRVRHTPTHQTISTRVTSDVDATVSNHLDSSQYSVPVSVQQWVTMSRGRTPKLSQTTPPSSPRDISPIRQSRLATSRAHKSPRTPRKYMFLSKEALDSLTKRTRKDSAAVDSDDDIGSVTSDVSFSSTLSEMVSMRFNLVEDLTEIMAMGRSTSWTDRKDAIMSLHHVLHTSRMFTKTDLKRITELCHRLFVEPHSKVFRLYLDFLGDFVGIHSEELHDWLFVLLLRLLHKLGTEIRGSLSRRLAKTVKTVRESFSAGLQFFTVMKIILDQTQPMNPKTKLAVLNFLLELIPTMDPQDLQNVADVRLGVTKLITFTSEPKSIAIRRAACCVLIALFDLNTATFTILLTQLSKHFRDIATRILQHHTKKEMAVEEVAAPSAHLQPVNEQMSVGPKRSASAELGRMRVDMGDRQRKGSLDKPVPVAILGTASSPTHQVLTPASRLPHGRSHLPTIRTHIRGASPLSTSTTSPTSPPANRRLDAEELHLRRQSPNPMVKESEVQRHSPGHQMAVERPGRGVSESDEVFGVSSSAVSEYNPARYQVNVNGLNGQTDSDEVTDTEPEPAEFTSLLEDLASSNSAIVEKALKRLIELARDEVFEFWEKHFSVSVTHVFTHLRSESSSVRSQALRAFYEVLRSQPLRFTPLTAEATRHCLETSKDSVETVSKSVDELVIPLANAVDPCECFSILMPVVAREGLPVLLIALKLLTRVIERLTADQLATFLPKIMPGLVTAYSHSASGVRKASVFCMVSVHVAVGDQMAPFLTQLTGSQMKLLNLYIKRATSHTSSPPPQASR